MIVRTIRDLSRYQQTASYIPFKNKEMIKFESKNRLMLVTNIDFTGVDTLSNFNWFYDREAIFGESLIRLYRISLRLKRFSISKQANNIKDLSKDNHIKERKIKKMSEATKFLRGQFSKFGMKEYAETYAVDSIVKSIKVRYGEELYFSNSNACDTVSKWISKYDKKYSNRNSRNDGTLVNCQFLFKIEDHTFGFVQVGNYINKYDMLSFVRTGGENAESDIQIYIFGRKYKKYVKELKDLINHSNTDDLYLYNIKGEDRNDGIGINSIGRVMDRRSLDTLFYNGEVKKTITDHIENFFANRHIYESKNLIYKTGILVYGDPGTGKTSLAVALASEYNYNLIVLDMTTFDKLDTSMLTSCINCDSDKFIVLLEDIDTLFTLDRDDKNIDKDNKTIINKMLQFLDSSSSPSDVIFLATTNHIEALDKALLRDGRFDLKVNIGNIDHATAKKMIESFDITDEKVIEEIISKAGAEGSVGLVNPATLQNKILEHFKEEVIKKESNV